MEQNIEKLYKLYLKGIINEEELNEKLKLERKKEVQRYVMLYLEGYIDEEMLISALTE
jgi:hypothetical protein